KAARHAGLPIQMQTTVVGTTGRLRVGTVELARLDDQGKVTEGTLTMPCDLVLMSGGFTPTVHLHSQSRGKLVWDAKTLSFIPGAAAERVRSAGACRGIFSFAAVLADGTSAGAAAAAEAGFATASSPGLQASAIMDSVDTAAPPDPPIGSFVGALPQPGGATGSMAFVDWQNDVTTKDLALATREGFQSVEHIKRYTTTGMATDQGKTSNLNALGFVSSTLDKAIPEVGLTTFRMPYTPVTFASFAGFARGALFDPIRRTPTHDWAARNGAVFEDV